MESDYDIVTATEDDRERIASFVCQHFYPREPLNQDVGAPPNRPISAIYALQFLADGLSLLAVSRADGGILGVCLSSKERAAEHRKTTAMPDNEAYAKICNFVRHVKGGVDVWQLSGADHGVYVQTLVVSDAAKGRGIGRALMETTRDRARAAEVPLMFVVCTSFISIKIADSIGMQRVYSVAYKDYKDEKGAPVFTPPPPHTETVVFLQKLTPDS
ncbi:arylalkylamine N-acetyltransferase 1-like [Periplaneta americana]|uniref:arylalkylamine N-acetyltransferase 1-like n=1 Tax=Periplaneta americana TaxID=6978 RepID=UPI0037E76E0A